MKKYKYVIVSPKNNHGGTIALHALCHFLSQQGENAKIFYLDKGYNRKNETAVLIYSIFYSIKDFFNVTFLKKPKTCILTCKRKWLPFISKNTIVIYPEIIYGNFFKSKYVVRWLLSNNKIYTNDSNKTIGYDKNDMFFCYRDVFNDEKLNPQKRKLTLTYFDLDTYKRYNFGERAGKCYILHKGAVRSDVPKHLDGPVIDSLSEKEKVKIFNECEYCICYDTQTAYSQIAALCGCISVVVPEAGKTRNDYRTHNGNIFDTGYGEAFGFSQEEIDYAKNTTEQLTKMFKKAENDSISNTVDFVKECEKYFNRM